MEDWKRGWMELADMVWPRKCGVCGMSLHAGERYVCGSCLADMPLTYFWSWRGNPAERMLWVRTYLQGVVPLFYYSSVTPARGGSLVSECLTEPHSKIDMTFRQFLKETAKKHHERHHERHREKHR